MNNEQGKTGMKIAMPSSDSLNSLDGPVSPHFGEAPTFTIVSLTGNEVNKIEGMANPECNCFGLIDSLAKKGINVLLVTNIGARPFMVAQSMGMDVRKIEDNISKKRALESYIKGETASFMLDNVCHGGGCHQ
jgi:predicted Fe-Mo cluster-binding NifX family protein